MSMISRRMQALKEGAGARQGTRYSADFTEQNKLLDDTRTHTKRIADKLDDALDSFGSTGSSMNRWEALGDAANRLGQRLPRDSRYTSTLLAAKAIEERVGQLQRRFHREVDERSVRPLRIWLKDSVAAVEHGRALLSKRRLGMDAAHAKLLKKDTVEARTHADEMKTLHDKALTSLQQLLDAMPRHHDHHRECLRVALEQQRHYYRTAADFIDATLAKIH